MRLIVHVGRVIADTFRYSFATRRFALLVVVLAGLLIAALVVTAQAVAPFAIYPFA
jgi:hypothetical protein